MSEYKIFEDINLENNKITKVSEISSYDGSGKYSDDVKNSGLYIHTPGSLASKTQGDVLKNKDKGLIVTTGHAQTRLDTVDNISDTINNTVKSHLNIKSEIKTDIVSPNIDIKSTETDPKTEILIKNEASSTDEKSNNDEGITVTTDRIKIISSTSKNKTTKYSKDSNLQSTILDFSGSVASHIDLDRADIYQANTEVFVAGTKYGYSSGIIVDAREKEISESDDKKGNALYVDPDEVNIYVDTTIKNTTTSIDGTLKQLGNVEINSDTNDPNSYYTHIDGTDLNVDTSSVNIGTENKTIDGIKQLKTSTINIGTANTHIKQSETDTDTEYRNTLAIGSDYSNLTIKGRDFLIDSEDNSLYTDKYNKKENKLSNDEYKSYLRSYYINSNNIYAHDLLTIGSNNDSTNPSHLQLNGTADITGNLDVDGNIDVNDTLLLHSSDSEDTTTSYIKSNADNESLQINNDTEVIISNAPNNGNDPNQISIKDTEIKTKKNLNLDSDLFVAGKIIFDSDNSPYTTDVNLIENLYDINTSSLKVSRISGNNTVLSISTASDDDSSASDTFSVDAKTLTLTSINGNDSVDTGTINTGRLKQTGNTYINTEDTTNELIVKGSKTSIESNTVNIGSDENSNTSTIKIGTVKADNTITIGTTNKTSNVIVKGKDLELTSKVVNSESPSKDIPSYLRISNINTDNVSIKSTITLGPDDNSKISHLQVNGTATVTGNLDVNESIDVKDTIWFHTKDSTESSNSTTSYIKSEYLETLGSHTEEDKSLRINNHKAVIISNSGEGSTDSEGVTIEPSSITTEKDLVLKANQNISKILTFDGDNKIVNLNTLQTDSLSINSNTNLTDDKKYNFLNLSYAEAKGSITLKPDKLTFNNTGASISVEANMYEHEVTSSTVIGNVNINDGNISNTTNIDGLSVYVNPTIVYIGNSDDKKPDTTTINIGNSTTRSSGTNVTIKGKNDFELISGDTESKITVDKVAISNASNSNKVNIYWDPATSTLIFEKE